MQNESVIFVRRRQLSVINKTCCLHRRRHDIVSTNYKTMTLIIQLGINLYSKTRVICTDSRLGRKLHENKEIGGQNCGLQTFLDLK